MSCGDCLWQSYLFITCLVSLLALTNILSIFPLNLHEFDTLPLQAQKDIVSHVRFRLAEYKERLAVLKFSMPRHDLMLHLNPQICYKGETAPDGTGPWPEEMTQYFCASRDLVDWCLKDYRLYQTTEKVFPLSGGYDLHVSLACYRIRLWNRYLDDVNILLCVISCLMVSVVFHSWYVSWKRSRGDYDHENENHSSPPETPPPPPPPKKKTFRDPAAPHPKLRSRHENYKSRR